MKCLRFVAVATLLIAACSSGDDESTDTDPNCSTKKACSEEDKARAEKQRTDGVRNGTETDVDCGGEGDIPRCADGKACKAGSDCTSAVCSGETCQAPSPTDGVKNGDESDVDCGGTNAPKCDTGKACNEHSDCTSDGCGYDKKCALARSCAGHLGGDTCGAGEVGQAGADHESCCAAAPISDDDDDDVLLDKYVVTAGRFRQFVERTGGDIKGFVEQAGSDFWDDSWTDSMPSNKAEVNFLLGPSGEGSARRGCDLNASRGRTYWMSDADNEALGDGVHTPATQDVLDEKALNCVDVRMLSAFCIWDGGRLASANEIIAAWRGGENRRYPWGSTLDTTKMNYKNNYQWPEDFDLENFIYVSAPGRRPEGNGKWGHADLAGLMLQMTSSGTFLNNGSWDVHNITSPVSQSNLDDTRGYWALGGRCARSKN